jgi:hypothetical protein
MAAATRPAFPPFAGRESAGEFRPPMHGLEEAMMNRGQLNALAGSADFGWVRFCGRGPPGTAVGLGAAKEVRP